MTPALAILAVGAGALAGLRWLRVGQREHYLPGSVLRFAARWWLGLPENAVLVALAVAGLAVSLIIREWAAAVTLAVVAAGPLGLGVRGRSGALAWTPRLRRVAAVAAIPLVGSALAVAFVGRSWPAVVGAVLAPLWVDLALLVLAPVERRLGERWVAQAAASLERSGAVVVAITGSYGKTTTKVYATHLLAAVRRVVASPASFNNRLGLARAVNEHLTPGTEIFVAEMGTYGPGEIREMCGWVRPRVGVMTAIGPVHLERMGSEEAIAAAKREILEGVEVGVLNIDHPLLARIADEEDSRIRVIRCSARARAEADVVADPATGKVSVGGEVVGTFDAASAHPGNVACAVGIALAVGSDPALVGERLDSLPTPPHRQAVGTSDRGFVILDDTFNANPAGARAGLAALERAGTGRRVVVTPGMVELGRRQAEENRDFGRAAAEVATDVVVVGRTNRRALVEGATAAGKAAVIVVGTREEAVEWVRGTLGEGDAVLYENDLPDHYP